MRRPIVRERATRAADDERVVVVGVGRRAVDAAWQHGRHVAVEAAGALRCGATVAASSPLFVRATRADVDVGVGGGWPFVPGLDTTVNPPDCSTMLPASSTSAQRVELAGILSVSVDSLMAPPPKPLRLASLPRRVPSLKSRLRIEPSLISRQSIEPVATPYDTPPIATNRAMQAMASAGEGLENRMRFFTGKSAFCRVNRPGEQHAQRGKLCLETKRGALAGAPRCVL